MPTARTASLTTKRLILAPLRTGDAQQMHTLLSVPELYRFTGGSPPTLEQLRRRFERQVAGSNEPDVTWHNWIIRLHDEDVAVGFVQATVSGDTADIAWLVGVPWQRRGIATEATCAMCDWLAAHGTSHFVAHIHLEHAASARVAETVGLMPTPQLDADGERIWSNQP